MGSIYQSIELLAKEKGIDATIVFDAVKDAVVLAARKQFKNIAEFEAEVDQKHGIQVFAIRKIVDEVTDPQIEWTVEEARRNKVAAPEAGNTVRIPLPMDQLGRISAQIAKQVILQKVREAERENVFGEFSHRAGELVNCLIKRIESRDIVVDLGKTEARLTAKEQSKLESFSVGDRIRCVIKAVEKTGKFAGVIVSRAAPELVQRLFEQEVPEIYDGTVVIKACAREAGERTKIAVFSRDRDVDSVGACVGMKGMRVQSIIRELRGEKIDIIPFSEDPIEFATAALNPAKVSRITILNAEDHHMEVVVDDSQLSLAIGKKGQNVRLAAKLLGWRIDIKSEEEKRQEVESQMAGMMPVATPIAVLAEYGLPEALIDALLAAGVASVESLGALTPEQLEALPGIEADSIQVLYNAINAYYAQPGGAVEEASMEDVAEGAAEGAAPEAAQEVLEETGAEATEAVTPEAAPAEEAPAEEVSAEEVPEVKASPAAVEAAEVEAEAKEEPAEEPAEEVEPEGGKPVE